MVDGEFLGRLEGEGRDMLFRFLRRQFLVALIHLQGAPEEVVAQSVPSGPLPATVSRLHHHENTRVGQRRELDEVGVDGQNGRISKKG